MTAKRFKKERGTFWDKDKRLNMDETVELLNGLYEENQLLKQRLAEQNDVEWLRNNTVWTTMPTSRRTYTTTSVSDKEKEQKMFLVDMEEQRKMFR